MNKTTQQLRPQLHAPPGACDCHMHVFGPRDRFPLATESDSVPAEATVDDYLALRRRLGIERTVVVQPSFYGTDNACTLEAIAALYPTARGIAVVPPATSEGEFARLNAAGIRGLRFSNTVKNAMRPEALETVANRIRAFGWHVQLRTTFRDLPDLEPILMHLPVDICIDHMSSVPPTEGVSHAAFKVLLRLIGTGRCWVKLSAPYKLSKTGPPSYFDMRPQARELLKVAPERLVWGSNWPHPHDADKKLDDVGLLDVLLDWVEDDAHRHALLVENPAILYGFER